MKHQMSSLEIDRVQQKLENGKDTIEVALFNAVYFKFNKN